MPKHFTVVLSSGLSYVRARTALAHGIGHYELGHCDDCRENEFAADRFAGVNLISPTEFDRATRRSSNLATISRDLQVTRRLLDAYLHWEY